MPFAVFAIAIAAAIATAMLNGTLPWEWPFAVRSWN
jgi:hypothetical protein